AEKTRIIFLGTFVSYKENGSYLIHDNGKPILKSKLKSLLEISNNKEFYRFFNKLLDAGIVKEKVINRSNIKLKWNTEYSFKGTASNKQQKETNLIKTFDKQVRELYQEKDEQGKR